MDRRNIVLILGAGASFPYSFPLGRGLIFEIARNFRKGAFANHVAKSLLVSAGFSEDFLETFCVELLQSHLSSVDAFLEQREDEYKKIGKLAIAATLIPHEAPDRLVRRPDEQGWYEYLYNLLGTQHLEFPKIHLSVITFNYDRSLEYFLFNSLKSSYGIGDKEALNLFSSIPIVHVYGQLGIPHFIDSAGRKYSTELTADAVQKSADGIEVIHEGNTMSVSLERAHEFIAQADVLCFLGFGYYETNLKRLGIQEFFKGEQIYGSAYKLREAERHQVEKLIYPKRIELGLADEDSLEFIRQHLVFFG